MHLPLDSQDPVGLDQRHQKLDQLQREGVIISSGRPDLPLLTGYVSQGSLIKTLWCRCFGKILVCLLTKTLAISQTLVMGSHRTDMFCLIYVSLNNTSRSTQLNASMKPPPPLPPSLTPAFLTHYFMPLTFYILLPELYLVNNFLLLNVFLSQTGHLSPQSLVLTVTQTHSFKSSAET